MFSQESIPEFPLLFLICCSPICIFFSFELNLCCIFGAKASRRLECCDHLVPPLVCRGFRVWPWGHGVQSHAAFALTGTDAGSHLTSKTPCANVKVRIVDRVPLGLWNKCSSVQKGTCQSVQAGCLLIGV